MPYISAVPHFCNSVAKFVIRPPSAALFNDIIGLKTAEGIILVAVLLLVELVAPFFVKIVIPSEISEECLVPLMFA